MKFSLVTFLKQATALVLVYALPIATCPIEASALSSWQEGAAPESVKLPNEQLDSLVAPIALYPDPLLAQVLVASTYPLEVIQLQQFLDKNKGLKDKALTDAVMKQDWDPAIQSLAALPDMVKILSENIKWTTDLGNAFLAQQNDVMNAVQRMRAKAQGKGQLKSTEQQKVETKVIENKEVIVIEQSKPDVVYVPSYDPVVVYGAPAYPYYPMAYPPGYAVAGMALSFGVGMMVGAAWGGGGWCCNSGWGGNNNININNNNNFVNNSNRQNMNNANRGNRPSNQPGRGGNSQWQHNPQHRGGAPYGDRKTASQFGGSARGDSMANRQASARQQQGRGMQQAGMRDGGRGAGPGAMDGGGRGGAGGMDRGSSGFGGDRAGSRDVSRGSGGGAFGGASNGMSGRSAGASQSRGSSSMGSRGGGGGGRSGGGGGGRSGGGRRR